MFFGQIIKANSSSQLKHANNDIVRISNISVDPNSKGKTHLFIIKNNEKFLIGTFDEHHTSLPVDLYFVKNENIEFSTQG